MCDLKPSRSCPRKRSSGSRRMPLLCCCHRSNIHTDLQMHGLKRSPPTSHRGRFCKTHAYILLVNLFVFLTRSERSYGSEITVTLSNDIGWFDTSSATAP